MIGTLLNCVEGSPVLDCELVEALTSLASKLAIHHEVIHLFCLSIPMSGSCKLRFQRSIGPTAVLGSFKWGKGWCILSAKSCRHKMGISCHVIRPIVRDGVRHPLYHLLLYRYVYGRVSMVRSEHLSHCHSIILPENRQKGTSVLTNVVGVECYMCLKPLGNWQGIRDDG